MIRVLEEYQQFGHRVTMLAQLVFLALAGHAFCAAIENCHMDRLVGCGDPLTAFRKKMGQSFPSTADQVDELCENMKEAKKCAEEFQNKCMTPMQLETMGFLAEGSLIAYRDFCLDAGQVRTDYLKHAQCLDENSKTDEAKSHYTYIEAALEDMSVIAPEKRLKTACCGYQWLQDKTTKLGTEKCGKEAVDAFQNVVDMAVSTLPSVLCSGFEPESETCKAVLPPPGAKPKGTIKNSHVAQTIASIYFPDVKV